MNGKSLISTKKSHKVYQKTWGNSKNFNNNSPLSKEKFKVFTERNSSRLQQQYPFLPKSQIRWKVKTLWEKVHVKKRISMDNGLLKWQNEAIADISDDEKAEPALKLSEQTDIFKRSRKEESIFSEDILMDLFPETEKVTQNTTEQERSIPDTDAVIDFSQLYEDDQEKIFL